ncbi:N-succinylglutamate 5-semialdehyde dehydrogenase [Rubripirellula obstinata]|uniref:L-glutamate gamma-semialdehyde dehydrogenase n=1 Tax=Rubripirellula obstinata TaxID=406547 RepID=A0A5B1CJ86_9BACT|nr:aldehyde dehydrogenase family protein [Rubripirellula obstinata]KAA1259995.1 N-succinylglutamate 5-semialdehyde dehydrogenase [Rubripirellula obstinata]
MNSKNNSANFTSISPINGQTLWTGETTSNAVIGDVFASSAVAADRWKQQSIDARIAIVRRYAEILQQRKGEIASLITSETGKLPSEAAGEVSASIAKVKWSIEALSDRRSETIVTPNHGADADPVRRIRYSPLGVTLVLGPFNFPLHLPGGQIIPALLAGNSVVFKPSDQSTAVGAWMTEAWSAAGLPSGVLQMIVGGIEVAQAAIDRPEVAAVFLTGSRTAGQSIHRQLAGRPEVLLALELGGNNPIVVDATADPASVANHVSYSAFVSSGQRCTCARRAVFVEGVNTEQQFSALVEKTLSLKVGMPDNDPPPQLGPLVSADAAASLKQTYDDLIAMGCRAIVPLSIDPGHPSLVSPAIVDATELSSEQTDALGAMEWFGPLLAVVEAANLEDAFQVASRTPYGLAASLLGGTCDDFQRLVDQVGAGVVNWNGPTTGAAGNLPFGGRGHSGNHRPAGFFAVDFCNEPVSSIETDALAKTDFWNPKA